MLKESFASPKPQIKHKKVFWGLGFVAGFLKGLIATGLGKLIVPGMWNHEKIEHPPQVIGSAVVIIFIVDIVAAITRMNPGFVNGLVENRNELFNVLMFVYLQWLLEGR